MEFLRISGRGTQCGAHRSNGAVACRARSSDGEALLPELLLEVYANVRFSWTMLGREPRSEKELLMVYAGILAHGTSMSAAEAARMMPQLPATSVRESPHFGTVVLHGRSRKTHAPRGNTNSDKIIGLHAAKKPGNSRCFYH